MRIPQASGHQQRAGAGLPNRTVRSRLISLERGSFKPGAVGRRPTPCISALPTSVPKRPWFGCVRERGRRETENGPQWTCRPARVVQTKWPRTPAFCARSGRRLGPEKESPAGGRLAEGSSLAANILFARLRGTRGFSVTMPAVSILLPSSACVEAICTGTGNPPLICPDPGRWLDGHFRRCPTSGARCRQAAERAPRGRPWPMTGL
jgi:hypothetical protein